MRKSARLLLLPMAAALLVTSCGTTKGDRAVSGAMIGAGTGAAVGIVTGDIGELAVIGAVAGAAIGALTSPQDVDLGTPAWRSEHYCVRRDEKDRCVETAPR